MFVYLPRDQWLSYPYFILYEGRVTRLLPKILAVMFQNESWISIKKSTQVNTFEIGIKNRTEDPFVFVQINVTNAYIAMHWGSAAFISCWCCWTSFIDVIM